MKKMHPLISIIVPIYNVEQYIHACISSIINQTYQNIEVFLVNDGSPDKCPEICDYYAEIDNRVTVIHKQNGGLSDARNAALKVARGKYILFVDSDDFIELNACEQLINQEKGNDPEIIVGNAWRIEGKTRKPLYKRNNSNEYFITGTQYLLQELQAGNMHMAVWLNLYKRDYLISNNFEFKKGLLHEDEQFTPRVFLKAKKVLKTEILFYNYIIRQGSITNGENKEINAQHMMKTFKELEDIYKNIEPEILRKFLNNDLVDKYFHIVHSAKLHKKEYSYLIDKSFLKNKAFTKKNKFRVMVFLVSKKSYFLINKLYKMV
ncbi:glycosyltransferase [Cohnella sp. 56]|uniref:glycosyltransferase n=1 Tax=Cohnella sp. 56 TaxID=3113722 RepID=UPI0030EA28EB